MVICGALGCKNRSGRYTYKKKNNSNKDSNIIDNNNNNNNNNNRNENGINEKRTLSFHRLPSRTKNKMLRQAWLDNVKRKKTTENFEICSDHFEADCFEKDRKVINFNF